MWILAACLSALFAGVTAILAKCGIRRTDPDVATAMRTGVVLILAWGIVFARGKGGEIKKIDRREFMFILLSGLATGASWLCYYYAIKNGVVSVAVPIDKLSVAVTVAFSCLFLREKLSVRALCGLVLMTAGTVLMAVFG